MTKGRLEAFSDGVIAVIITIMVLEIKAPHGEDIRALLTLWPAFVAYVLSFVFVGIYWNNHHHLLQAAEHIDGRVMWANLHLLFWLSLIPFATAWLGEAPNRTVPTALYGFLLLMNAIAYTLLLRALLACNGPRSKLARATTDDRKGKVSVAIYVLGLVAAFSWPLVAYGLFIVVAIIWFVPDRRIARVMEKEPETAD